MEFRTQQLVDPAGSPVQYFTCSCLLEPQSVYKISAAVYNTAERPSSILSPASKWGNQFLLLNFSNNEIFIQGEEEVLLAHFIISEVSQNDDQSYLVPAS